MASGVAMPTNALSARCQQCQEK